MGTRGKVARTRSMCRENIKKLIGRAVFEVLERRMLLSSATIIAENLLPGTPQSTWDVSGSGDPTLQGFATSISVNVGTTESFKVDDTALASYRIDIYRMGYYQGDGARLITTINTGLETVQPNPTSNNVTGLVDAGNWSVSASWAVPSTAVSGLYFARLTRTDTGGASLIFFVVRNDASHSDILVKVDDATWEAYNQWGGGNSFYSGYSVDGALGLARL